MRLLVEYARGIRAYDGKRSQEDPQGEKKRSHSRNENPIPRKKRKENSGHHLTYNERKGQSGLVYHPGRDRAKYAIL